MVFGLLMYSKEILSFIFGSDGVHDGSLLLEILIPGSIFMSVLLITNSLLEALGDVKAPVYSMMIGCAFKLIITYLAVGNESLGISGAPIGTVVLYAVALTVSSHRLARRHKIILPIFSTHIVPYMNAFISVAVSKKIFSMVLSWKNESIALLFAIIFSALIYAALSLFCGTISSKKIKMMANYTKIKG
jgi:stage V sporulation protein B